METVDSLLMVQNYTAYANVAFLRSTILFSIPVPDLLPREWGFRSKRPGGRLSQPAS